MSNVSKASDRSAVLAVALLVLFSVQAIGSLREKSITFDELVYITAGYYHLRSGDFHYNVTNPPLMKMAAAAPLLLVNPSLRPLPPESIDWTDADAWVYARDFFFNNDVDPDNMLFLARLPMVLIGILIGALIYLWSGALFGRQAGWLSLFLYAFSPNMLAHTRLATQEIGLAAGVLVVTYLFWSYTERPRVRTLVALGLAFGLGMATKSTIFLVLPAFGLYLLKRAYGSPGFGVHEALPLVRHVPATHPRARQAVSLVGATVVVMVLAGFSLNLTYGFQGTIEPIVARAGSPSTDGSVGSRPDSEEVDRGGFASVPALLPSAYLEGLAYQRRLGESSPRVFFAGSIYEDGAWYLTVMAVLLKTPIPTLLLLACVVGVLVTRGPRSDAEWLLLAVSLVFLGVFSYMGGLSGKLRYVLPAYPLLFVLIGRLATELPRPRYSNVALGVLCAWYAVGSSLIYPHYLAYFNESVGGPRNGYRYLVDSNLDWGQDLKGLKRYMVERGIGRIRLGYFGSADAGYYGIDYDFLPSVGLAPRRRGQDWWFQMRPERARPLELESGLVAVSATLLGGPSWMGRILGDAYAPLRELEPVDSVGYSILIFDIP